MLLKVPAETDALALDMTPMIDAVFNLLIFFLVASSFQQIEREMQIALPEARAAGPLSAALREIVVNVDADGRIIVNSRTLAPEELDALVREAVAANPEQKVAIRGDRSAAYEKVARALDICKHAGVQQPFLDTIPIE
ncbi:MAG: hypothetical protein CHACPFDD_02962 [Phycisphaerae bacterium]|nr:hypothetical protein [Phycisphaerae bacterium]